MRHELTQIPKEGLILICVVEKPLLFQALKKSLTCRETSFEASIGGISGSIDCLFFVLVYLTGVYSQVIFVWSQQGCIPLLRLVLVDAIFKSVGLLLNFGAQYEHTFLEQVDYLLPSVHLYCAYVGFALLVCHQNSFESFLIAVKKLHHRVKFLINR